MTHGRLNVLMPMTVPLRVKAARPRPLSHKGHFGAMPSEVELTLLTIRNGQAWSMPFNVPHVCADLRDGTSPPTTSPNKQRSSFTKVASYKSVGRQLHLGSYVSGETAAR